ncbi:MAG TPA: ATP-binding protein [Gemmatimonadaceae bacterium]|nr:ATP-binding protein [Gemmatimonadaceae bacterium]
MTLNGYQRSDAAALAERLATAESELEALREELETTNRGVVALYAELEDQAERLRHASELKSRFLSYISHEFRTPLGAIKSLSGILLDQMDGPLSAEQQKQVRFVRSSADELLELVNDQLDLAKLEAGRLTVSPAWFEMVDLFSTLRGMFKPILLNENLSLTFEEPRGDVKLYTDDRKLSQILRNFISNALKFTPQGEVRVRAMINNDGTVTFTVSDTGIGIPIESLTHIFDDFTQVETPLNRRLRGTGLGLSLCRRLARLLGGEVAVESTLGAGSTFSVTIPLKIPAVQS